MEWGALPVGLTGSPAGCSRASDPSADLWRPRPRPTGGGLKPVVCSTAGFEAAGGCLHAHSQARASNKMGAGGGSDAEASGKISA